MLVALDIFYVTYKLSCKYNFHVYEVAHVVLGIELLLDVAKLSILNFVLL